ncbi:MAG: hypothetical protein GWN39_10840 [Thermoplasmata archaeon]|nr:hypothetical protein [Thermoplasmata archaeon]NIT77823.1 hypothetical protein [Thermoplasmata archaeon]NIU49554.1 hypothetical protein [Thermoplasmata archaeon]NIV79225.1 hypothetical protein [Thermoplasmata archaeon]NIY04193.1 hypothetical protein [Thermoplasmata archaeon]
MWIIFMAGAAVTAAYIVVDDAWSYIALYVPLSALIGVVAAVAWHNRDRHVWSSVHRGSPKDPAMVVETLDGALDVRPVVGHRGAMTFHDGDAIVVVRGRGTGSEVFVGPVDRPQQVERLKGLVDRVLA